MGNQDHFVEGGYIILSRQLLESRAWKSCNHKQKVMLITSLLNANHKDKAWWNGKEYVDVKKSSFITSRDKFARNTDTTPRKVRTFWNKMEKVGFLTIKSTKQYSVVNICNYNIYQDPKIYKRPSKRQSSDQAATTNNNDKERKEIYSALYHNEYKAAALTILRYSAPSFAPSKSEIDKIVSALKKQRKILNDFNLEVRKSEKDLDKCVDSILRKNGFEPPKRLPLK